jgi:PAS domain S-box-containing protein
MTINRMPPRSPVADPDRIARLEKALEASDERFRTLVQLSFDVYWESDAQHRFTRQDFAPTLSNAPAPGSELGKTRWEVPYLAPDEEAWRRHRATLDAHLPFRDFELARPTAGGGVRHVSVSGFPVFGEDGCFLGYRGVGRDITERKRTEALDRLHLWVLESMDRVSRALQGAQDIDTMIGSVLEATLDIFSCDRVWLAEPRDAGGTAWLAMAERARPPFSAVALRGTELACGDALSATLAAALAAQGAVQARPAALAERHGVRAQLAIALHPQGSGQPRLLCLHQCTRARDWSDEEARLLREIAARLADAWGNLMVVRHLRDSERRLAAAQSIAHVGWWERDYVTGRVALSDEASRIFGVDPVDMPHWQGRWLGLIHPDDRARTAEASEVALRGGPRYDVEYRVVRPDGAVRMVHSQGDVIRDEAGHPVRQFGVMQDITDLWQAEQGLRASESRFRTFVDRAADAFFLMDEQLAVVDVNRQACEGLGYSREELIGMHPRDFDVALDEPSIDGLAERALADETVTFETCHRRRDGSVFPVEIRTGVFHQGGRRFYLALARDITRRKLADERLSQQEQALQAARTQLAHVSRLTMLGELASSIAHEVSQPLGAMITSAGACARWLAAAPPHIAEAKAALDNIAADGKRARDVIARIRALIRHQVVRRESVDINQEVTEVLALTEHELQRHGILRCTDLDLSLPRVSGDRIQLQQVLLNLILNAAEAMSTVKDRARLLTIASRRHGADAVLVEVADTGCGLDPERLDEVFEPFYTTKEEGVGIGLSISRSIVEAHGGRLWAGANHPRGAIFQFTLPVEGETQP